MLVDDVRVEIYRSFLERARPPMPQELVTNLGSSMEEVQSALEQLDQDDVIALLPGTHFVWLAHPFSALAGPFETRTDRGSWDAICVWDALGILTLLESDGSVRTLCPDCGDELVIEVRDGEIAAPPESVVHYGVPARKWYEDLAYT
jgi:hypothetical protein